MNRERIVFPPRSDPSRGFYIHAEVHDTASDVWGRVQLRDLILRQGRGEVGLNTNANLMGRIWI